MFDIKRPKWVIAGAVALLAGLLSVPAVAQSDTPDCEWQDTSEKEEVVDGVILTWDSSFLCDDAADVGTYEINGEVTNTEASNAGVALDNVVLSHTTPPGSDGSVDSFTFDDAELTPGETTGFTVTGNYELVETDEGKKANLHLRINGSSGDETFALGVNVHVRGPGAVEDGDDGDDDNNDTGPPFPVPPTGDDTGDDTDTGTSDQGVETEVLDTEVDEDETDETDETDEDEGLAEAIAELSEEVPGDANDVRDNVKEMLEFIAGNGNGDEEGDEIESLDEPGTFGKAVADLAHKISDEDEGEDEEEQEEEDEENEEDNEDDNGEGAETKSDPPEGIPTGRP